MVRIPIKATAVSKAAAKAVSPAIDTAGTMAAGALGAEKVLGRMFGLNPEISMFTSVLDSAREFAENFFRRDFAQAKNFDNAASKQGVELDYEIGKDVLLGSMRETSNIKYAEYRARVQKQGGVDLDSKIINERVAKEIEDGGGRSGNLRNRQYMTEEVMLEEVTKTIRRMEEGVEPAHRIPEINNIAREYKNKMFDPLLQRQIDNGLLSEKITKDKDFVASYVSQIWDTDSIQRNPQKFLDITARAFDKFKAKIVASAETALSKATEKARNVKSERGIKSAEKRIAGLAKKLENRKSFDSRKAAEGFYSDLLNHGNFGMSSRDLFGELSRFQKHRKLHIPKDMLSEFEPYMENNIDRIGFLYTRSVLPRILLKERFGEVSLKTYAEKISKEALDKATKEGLTIKERMAIQKESARMLRYLEAMRDRFLGIYALPKNPNGVWQRISDFTLRSNLVTKLGGVLFSSIPDVARLIARNGLIRTGEAITSILSNREAWDVAKQDLKSTLGIYELLLQDRFFLQAEINRGVSSKTKAEKLMQKMSNSFGKITLISYWNEALKMAAGMTSANGVIREAKRLSLGGKIDQRIMNRFLEGGLDEKALRDIALQFDEYGVNHNGLLIAQSADWKNREAAEAFNRYLKREVDITITTPGMGSKPLVADTPFGRHALQFRSFAFTATNGILLSGLQHRDAMVLNGMLMSIFLGAGVYALKEMEKGNEVDYSPNVLLAEGIDRSGILGYISDASNIIDRASRGRIGINPMLGAPGASRYRPFDMWTMLGGPTSGTVRDISRLIGSTAAQEYSEGDATAFRRLFPYQNVSYMRFLFDSFEEGLKKAATGEK